MKQEISVAQVEVEQIQNQIESLSYQKSQYEIKSPIQGIIFDLEVKKPGSVVSQGDFLANIAPVKSRYIVFRGQVQTKDSGLITSGSSATIELDSFPSKEFGTVSGTISQISPTSIETEDGQDIYELEIKIDRNNYSDSEIKLIYGQTGTAEIVVRKRSVLDLLFSL